MRPAHFIAFCSWLDARDWRMPMTLDELFECYCLFQRHDLRAPPIGPQTLATFAGKSHLMTKQRQRGDGERHVLYRLTMPTHVEKKSA